jgi:integrase
MADMLLDLSQPFCDAATDPMRRRYEFTGDGRRCQPAACRPKALAWFMGRGVIPLNKVLKEVLKKIEKVKVVIDGEEKTLEHVFINPITKKKYEYRDKFLGTLCAKAGVKRFMFHNLRHFGAILLSSSGAGTSDIQGILGHSQASTTDKYIQSLRPGMVKAVKKMEGIK